MTDEPKKREPDSEPKTNRDDGEADTLEAPRENDEGGEGTEDTIPDA